VLTALRTHPNEKAMILFSFSLVGLECSFHLLMLNFFIRGSMLLNLSLSVKLENQIIPLVSNCLVQVRMASGLQRHDFSC
jgi:hypothetical protein